MTENQTNQNMSTLKFFLGCHALLGLTTVAMGIASLTTDKALIEFADIFLSSLDVSLRTLSKIMLFGPLVCGILVFLFAIVAMHFARRGKVPISPRTPRPRKDLDDDSSFTDELVGEAKPSCLPCCGNRDDAKFRSAVIYLTILFFTQIAGASLFLIILQSTHNSIESIAVSSRPLGGFESDISTLQLAIFNLCCYEENWSIQGKVPPCEPGKTKPPPCELPDKYSRYSEELCTCYSSDRYDEFYSLVSEDDKRICQVLSNLVVEISNSDQIPGTDMPISAVVPVRESRIVGFNGASDDNPSPSYDRANGYGCGFGGFAKGFQWAQFKYMSERSKIPAVILICVSVAELIVLVFIVCVLRSVNDDEYFDGVIEKMASERKKGGRFQSFLDSPRFLFSTPKKSKAKAKKKDELAVTQLNLDP